MQKQINNIIRSIQQATYILFSFITFVSFSYAQENAGRNNNEEKDRLAIRAAVVQFKLDSNVTANTLKICQYISEAAEKGSDLVVFPETAVTGYIPFYKVEKVENICTQSEVGRALNSIRQAAFKNRIAVAVGTAWQDENKRWWNRAFFIDENGESLEYYDKIQLTGSDREYFQEGKQLKTFQWRGIQLGMLICYDMRYPELWRLMRMEEVQLVLHLAAAFGNAEWKVPVLEGTLRGHAASNGYYILSSNNAGPVQMVISTIYNPKGLILAKANYGIDEIIFGDLEIGLPNGDVNYRNDIYQLIKMEQK